MSAQGGLAHLAQAVEANAGKTGALRVDLTLNQAREIQDRIGYLTEVLVTAAALHAGRIKDASGARLAAQELDTAARRLAAEHPELKSLLQGGV